MAFIAILGLVGDRDDRGSIVMIAGSVALLVALAGLSAFQARAHPVMTWAAFALSAVGTTLVVHGIVIDSWGEFSVGLLITFVGLLLFAIATYRTGALPRRATILLGVGSACSIVSFVLPLPLALAAWGTFALGLFALGVQTIRLDRPLTTARPA